MYHDNSQKSENRKNGRNSHSPHSPNCNYSMLHNPQHSGKGNQNKNVRSKTALSSSIVSKENYIYQTDSAKLTAIYNNLMNSHGYSAGENPQKNSDQVQYYADTLFQYSAMLEKRELAYRAVKLAQLKRKRLFVTYIISFATALVLIVIISGFVRIGKSLEELKQVNNLAKTAQIHLEKKVQLHQNNAKNEIVLPQNPEMASPIITDISDRGTTVKDETSMTKAMVKSQNTLNITSQPSGAAVSLHGQYIGTTPFLWENPWVYGSIHLVIEKQGYEKKETYIEYNGGNSNSHVVLTPEPEGKELHSVLLPSQESVPMSVQKKNSSFSIRLIKKQIHPRCHHRRKRHRELYSSLHCRHLQMFTWMEYGLAGPTAMI